MEKNIIELEILEEEGKIGIEAISLVDEPATESYWVYFKSEKPESKEYKLALDNDKRILVGAIAIPELEIYRAPLEGETEPYYIKFSAETIEKMNEKFMKELRLGETNIMHKDSKDGGSYVYESWIVENLEDKANTVYKLDVPIGTWVVKMRVESDEVWEKVKSGELQGLSLQGLFVPKVDNDELEARDIIEKLKTLLEN